jgi:hypothetical protein
MTTAGDRTTMRDLATQWMGWAADPVMEERKRAWRAVHDLKSQRPVILFETDWIDGFVGDEELLCEDPLLRGVERNRDAREIDVQVAAHANDRQ